MSHTAIRRAVPLGLFVLAAYGVTDAQEPPDPGLSYIYPPAVRAGETTGVRLAGSDWTPDLDILLHDPQVRLELIGRRGPLLVPEPPFVTGPKAYSPPPLPREQRETHVGHPQWGYPSASITACCWALPRCLPPPPPLPPRLPLCGREFARSIQMPRVPHASTHVSVAHARSL